MSPSITEFPQDIFFVVATYLDVADLLSLLSTCHVIREIQFQKSVWLSALIRLKEVQNRPLPVIDWAASDVRSLQDLVQRTNRLMKNWESDNPRPVHKGTIGVVNMTMQHWTSIIVIPGLNLVLSYTGSTLGCWDILARKCVATLEIWNLQLEGQNACMDVKGEALIGGCIGSMGHVESMVAIYISYDRPQISIFPVFSLPTTSSYPERSCFFVNSRVMGFCTPSSIVFWCMNASAEVQERPEIFLQPVRNQFAAFRLYLPDAQETIRMRPCLQLGHRIYHFERGLTSDPSVQSIPFVVAESDYWTDDGPHTVTLSVSYPFDSEALRASGNITAKMFFYAHHLFSPEYGVLATTCRGFTWDGHHTSVVHFWPGKSTADETLDVGQGYFYEVPDRIRQTAVSASGRYMLLVHTGNYHLGRNNIHEYLGLLHFNLTPTPHITFRKLDVGVITSESCDQIAIDDALGLVFVVDIAGMVTIYSFV